MEQEADKLIGSHICYWIYQLNIPLAEGLVKTKQKRTTQQKATIYYEILQCDISNCLDNVTYHHSNNVPDSPQWGAIQMQLM